MRKPPGAQTAKDRTDPHDSDKKATRAGTCRPSWAHHKRLRSQVGPRKADRLDELTTRYEEGQTLMQTILKHLNGPSSQRQK